jgi:hypothetical protein
MVMVPAMADGIAGKLELGGGGAHFPLEFRKFSWRYFDDGM